MTMDWKNIDSEITDFLPDLKNIKSKIPHASLLICSILTLAIIFTFIGFIFYIAYPTFESQGLIGFITGTEWSYEESNYGIWIFIMGTLIVTAMTLVLAVPISVFTAIYLSEFASRKLASRIRPFIELLVGIPSVVYGIFGLYVLEGLFRSHIDPAIDSVLGFIPIFNDVTTKSGEGVLLASTVLAIMILPTVTSITEDAVRSVPSAYRDAAYALGATHWEAISRVVVPSASNGIVTGVVLGMMRAVGETMAIVMLMGNIQVIPTSIFGYGYAMTSKILNDITFYIAEPEPRSALFAIGAVLFALEMLLVGVARVIGGVGGNK